MRTRCGGTRAAAHLVSGTHREMQCFWNALNSFSSVAASSACGRIRPQNCADAWTFPRQLSSPLRATCQQCCRAIRTTPSFADCVRSCRGPPDKSWLSSPCAHCFSRQPMSSSHARLSRALRADGMGLPATTTGTGRWTRCCPLAGRCSTPNLSTARARHAGAMTREHNPVYDRILSLAFVNLETADEPGMDAEKRRPQSSMGPAHTPFECRSRYCRLGNAGKIWRRFLFCGGMTSECRRTCVQASMRLLDSPMSCCHKTVGGYSGMPLSLSSRKRWLRGSLSASRSSWRSMTLVLGLPHTVCNSNHGIFSW